MSQTIGLDRRKFLKGAGVTALAGVVGTGGSVATAVTEKSSYSNDGKFDFDTPYSRIGTDCVKWDEQMELFGEDLEVGMGVADLDFQAAPCIREALAERSRHENWGYLKSTYTSYIEAIVDWNRERHTLEVDPETIVVAAGVHPGLIATLRTFSPPASKVLMMTPTYNGFYSDLTRTNTIANDSEMIFTDGRYEIDWDDFEARMTPDTHSMLLCNPQNPTGNVWSEADLLRIGELCLKHQVVVLADEIHCDFVRAGQKYTPFASLPDKDVVNNSLTFKAVSKTFNLPAMKSAYWFSTNPVFAERVRVNHRADVNTLGVVANEAAYRHGREWFDQLLPYIDDNHSFVENYIKKKLPQVGYTKAQGTFLSWLHFGEVMDAIGAEEKSAASQKTDTPMTPTEVFEAWLAKNARVQLNDGESYGTGGERCMRMNIGTSRRLIAHALNNIAVAVSRV